MEKLVKLLEATEYKISELKQATLIANAKIEVFMEQKKVIEELIDL